jgi:hypothetical protein
MCKRAGGVTQMVECLHNKHEALSSTSTKKFRLKFLKYGSISFVKVREKQKQPQVHENRVGLLESWKRKGNRGDIG